jgi:hypothetical protein
MTTKEEMIEALDAGYILCHIRLNRAQVQKLNGQYLFTNREGDIIERALRVFDFPEDYEILRPDLTKPQIVHLDHKGWAWDNDPEDAKEKYLYSVQSDGRFRVWVQGKTGKEWGFDSYLGTIPYENFSWEDPRQKPIKIEITLTLTEGVIEKINKMLGR